MQFWPHDSTVEPAPGKTKKKKKKKEEECKEQKRKESGAQLRSQARQRERTARSLGRLGILRHGILLTRTLRHPSGGENWLAPVETIQRSHNLTSP
jgi:hypothetical protein